MKDSHKKPGPITLIFLTTWTLYLIGAFIALFLMPSDSVFGLLLIPVMLLALVITPVAIVNWIILAYKKIRTPH